MSGAAALAPGSEDEEEEEEEEEERRKKEEDKRQVPKTREQPLQQRARSAFWGFWGAQPPKKQGGAGGRSLPVSRQPHLS